MMKRALRCHDFGSGREASRSQYVDIDKGSDKAMGQNRASPWMDIGLPDACAGVAAKIGANIVGRLGHMFNMPCAVLRVITDIGSQRTRVSSC
jgi:hypothetical protein